MAVATTNAFSGPFTANGVTTTFPFTFTVLSGDDVAVALRDAAGVETPVSSGFVVVLAGDAPASGSVVFDAAPASGNEVWIYLNPAFTQETEFADGHPFIAGAVNGINDMAALRDQVLKRDVDRALVVPIGEDGLSVPAADARAGKYVKFAEDGGFGLDDPDNFAAPAAASATLSQAWAEGTLPGGAGTKSAKEHAEDAAQSAAYAGGFETPEYASQSAGNAATAEGQIFRVPIGTTPQTFNWYRRLSSGSELVSPLATMAYLATAIKHYTPEMYNAAGDGTTDDTTAFANMATAINTNGSAHIILSGTYRVQAVFNGSVCRLEDLTALQFSGEGKVVADPLPATWKSGTSASAVGTTVTVLDATHTLIVGSEIIMRGLSVSSANGFQTVTTITPGVSFSYVCGVAPGAMTGTPQYTAADYGRSVFRLDGCSNVSGEVRVEGEARPVDQQYRFGYRGVYASGTCENHFLNVRGKGLSYGYVQGDTLTRGKVSVTGEDMGYPASTENAPYVDINVDADTVHRGVYYANGGGNEIVCRAANYDVAAVLITRTTNGYSMPIKVRAPAAPQTAALTLHRASGGVNVLVTTQNAITGGYQGIDIETSLVVTDSEGLGRFPTQFDMSLVTGRIDNVTVNQSIVRNTQTDAAQIEREFAFSAPASCTVGDLSVTSICKDPGSFESSSSTKGFTVNIAASDGVIQFDRRGGRTGYFMTLPTNANVQWANPKRPMPAGGVRFSGTASKQVIWTAGNPGTGDFTVWMRTSSPLDTTGARALFFAGTSSAGRSTNGMWATYEGSSNDLAFYILGGASVNDSSARRYLDIDKYMIVPGYNDLFFVRRSGVLELWVNGVKLVGTQFTSGTAPGEGGSLTTPLIAFNSPSNNPFANELGGSGYYTKALTIDEMAAVVAGGAPADKTVILHQTDYVGTRRTRYTNPYSTHTATIEANVSLTSPSAILTASAAIDAPSIAGGAIHTATTTVTGALVGAAVFASPRTALPAGIVQMNPGRVSATDTVAIDLLNVTAGAIDPASITWDVSVVRG